MQYLTVPKMKVCYLWVIVCLTFVGVLSDMDTVNRQVADAGGDTGAVPVPVLSQETSQEGKSGELEIEDVETEGAGGTLEGGELGHNDEDGVPGSGNQSESDPTAVAKVYDDHVPNFVSKEVAEGTKGETPTAGSALKMGRVKVACWDFRTMKHPPFVSENTETVQSNLSEEKGVYLPDASSITTNIGESEEATSSGEDSETTEKFTEAENIEKTVDVAVESNDSPYDNYHDETPMDRNVESNGNMSNRTVEIVNMTTLLHEVLYSNPMLKDRGTPSNCSMVMFYATWCPFSAKAAPHFNALPRAYLPMRVAAIDSSKYKNVNTYFGILSVPSVVLFHNGKIIAKFNDTSFTLNKFAEFIEYFTDLKHEERMNVTTKDFEGPLSSTPTKEIDWYLYMAWIFLIGCFFHYVTKSSIWKRAVDYVRTVWREAQAQHEHMD